MRSEMAEQQLELAARIIFRAILPLVKVLIAEDPGLQKLFSRVQGRVMFVVQENGLLACLDFKHGQVQVGWEDCQSPDLVFKFSSMTKMIDFFRGKPVLPRIQGWYRLHLLLPVLILLLKLKILMPDSRPKDLAKKRLKVKLAFYMITTALSQYNKGGDPEMQAWTARQPERIYQISVEPEGIYAYLRVKAGKSKAGRGVYARRRPFVHLKFNGVAGAFPVIMNDVDMVTAVRKGYLEIVGAPEYASDLGNFMMRIQDLVT